MKKLKMFFSSQAQFSARILAAALLIGTACAWYAILKPELKIKADDSESLRRRIEAAISPGRAFIGSPVLVRTANKRYLVTIQENKLADAAYKAELADYLKAIAKQESRAQLDVVFAKSPSLLVKSAVSSLFNSSSAPFFITLMFLALVRFFFAPVSAAVANFSPFITRMKDRFGEYQLARKVRALELEQARLQAEAFRISREEALAQFKREEEAVALERAEAQLVLDREIAALQAEANKAFAAQAATAELQRLAFEAAEAEAQAREAAKAPGIITEIEISASDLGFNETVANEAADEDVVQVSSIAEILAKAPKAGPIAQSAMAAPLKDEPETFASSNIADLSFVEEAAAPAAAATPASAAALVDAADDSSEEQADVDAERAPRKSFLAPLKAKLASFNEARERRRDRIEVQKRNAAIAKAAAESPLVLKAEVDRLTSQLNGAKLSWLETATELQKQKMRSALEQTQDLNKLGFVESENVEMPKAAGPSVQPQSEVKDADFI
jgi:hypothetical protein